MKTFLLIAQPNSYRIAPYIAAANEMGLDVLIASAGEHSLVTEVNQGLHINLDNHSDALASIAEIAKQRNIVGILGSDDSTVELAAKTAEKLGLPHNPANAAKLSRRKDLARAHLASQQCPVPYHRLINVDEHIESQITDLPFPCVIKPLNMSASRGVIRANNQKQLVDACQRVKKIISENIDLFEKTHVLVEQYIDGIEIAYEGWLSNGELHLLTIFDKPEPMTGPYFEETIYVTPSMLDVQTIQKATESVAAACKAYGLTTGPIHAELRINNENAWILEVASRTIGGDCARTLDTGSNYSLEKLTIQLACGETPEIEHNESYKGVMMIPVERAGLLRRVEGLLQAKQVEHIDDIKLNIAEGHELTPLPEGNQYSGYIFASADTSEKVVNALKQAHNKLNFVTAPIWSIEKTAQN